LASALLLLNVSVTSNQADDIAAAAVFLQAMMLAGLPPNQFPLPQ
jgi:hypothetical protein